jgi:hypothetical protein
MLKYEAPRVSKTLNHWPLATLHRKEPILPERAYVTPMSGRLVLAGEYLSTLRTVETLGTLAVGDAANALTLYVSV